MPGTGLHVTPPSRPACQQPDGAGTVFYAHFIVSLLNRVQLFCDPIDCSLPGSSVRGLLQAGMLVQAGPCGL